MVSKPSADSAPSARSGAVGPGALAWMVPIVAGALALRVVFIGRDGYWWDEGYSIHWARMPLGEMLSDVARGDFNPPLYYVLLNGWMRVFGTGEAATRLLSALLSTAAVPLVFAVGARLAGRRVGIVAAALAAASAYQITYAQEARTYALMTLLVLASMLALLRWVAAPGVRAASVYVACTALLCYAHAYGGMFVVAQLPWVLALRRRAPGAGVSLRRFAVVQLALAATLLPYAAFVATKARTVAGGFWIARPTLAVLPQTLRDFTGSRVAAVVLGALAALGVAAALRASRPRAEGAPGEVGAPLPAALLVPWLLLPVLVPVAISLWLTPVYVPRYAIGSTPALLVLAAWGICALPAARGARAVALAAAAAVSVAAVYGHFTKVRKQPWREAAAWVERNARPGDLVLVSDRPGLVNMLGHYLHRTDLRRVALTEDVRLVAPDELDRRLELVDAADRVWWVACFQVPAVAGIEERLAQRFPSVTATPIDGRSHVALRLYERPALGAAGPAGR